MGPILAPSPRLSLHVIVVGAGIGGLAATVALSRSGHNITALESAPELLEVGAGIQVAPNMLRVLDSWDLGQEIRRTGSRADKIQVLRWQNGAELSATKINQAYGEQLVIHRGDLYAALLNAVKKMPNVIIRENSPVVDLDFELPSVRLQSGETIMGDVIIGSDGIKSTIRSKLLGDDTESPIPTGDAAFRLQLPGHLLDSHPVLGFYLRENVARRWIGPDRHVMGYPVKGGRIYNLVMVHPDRGGLEESWTKQGSKETILQEFEGWDTELLELIRLVPDEEVLVWKLCVHRPLKKWVSDRCALLGDACHPMLPYVAQGAAQAVEDAASLGIVLSKISSKDQIPFALKAYERARKERAEKVQSSGTANREVIHMHDGPEQAKRDQLFLDGKSPDLWVNDESRRFLWSWDATVATEQAWKEEHAVSIVITSKL